MNNLTEVMERLLQDLQLANLTRALMGHVRVVTESDEETLIRVINEYKAAKYDGIKIPGSLGRKREK